MKTDSAGLVSDRDEKWARSSCTITRALARVGHSWSMLILRDIARGLTRFDDIRLSLGIAPNVLTRRLAILVETGLLERARYQDHPPRDRYLLTELGRDFIPVLCVMGAWGRRHFAEGGAALDPAPMKIVLVDGSTGKALEHGQAIFP